jgi:acyl-CoA thioesterase
MHFGRHVGIRFEHAAAGRGRYGLELREIHLNPNGVVHGGVTYALVDQAMGAALYSQLAPGESAATLEIKINYLRAATTGHMAAEAWVVQREGDVVLLESDVRVGDSLIAKALGTYMVLAPKNRPRPEAP